MSDKPNIFYVETPAPNPCADGHKGVFQNMGAGCAMCHACGRVICGLELARAIEPAMVDLHEKMGCDLSTLQWCGTVWDADQGGWKMVWRIGMKVMPGAAEDSVG